MKLSILTLLLCCSVISESYAASIHEEVPDGCVVVESFTLYSNSVSPKNRAKELEKGTQVEFTGVIFSEKLYLIQSKKEEKEYQQWLKSQPSNLLIDPNFHGVPKNTKKINGVLVFCDKTDA